MTVRTSAHIGSRYSRVWRIFASLDLCKQERLYSTFVGAYLEYLHVYTKFVKQAFEIEQSGTHTVDVDFSYRIEP